MHLTDQQIESFRRIYKKCFGEDISKDLAREKAIRLIRLMQIIIKNNKNKPHEK